MLLVSFLEFGESSRNSVVEVTNAAAGYQDEPHRNNCVKPCKDTDRHSEDDTDKRSPTPSVDKLNRLIGPSPTPRMLTPYEIELLRKSKREVDQVVGEVLASKDCA